MFACVRRCLNLARDQAYRRGPLSCVFCFDLLNILDIRKTALMFELFLLSALTTLAAPLGHHVFRIMIQS